MEPEYLSLFTNTGNFTIQVRFKDSDSSIATQTMKAEEIKIKAYIYQIPHTLKVVFLYENCRI